MPSPKISVKDRAAERAIGLSAKRLISGSFDWLLYPAVIYYFGIIKGGIVMTFLSIAACLGMLRFYDRSKRDWLGIEAIKGIREYKGDRRIGRLIAWALNKGDGVVFLILSINLDPFITTAYMRQGKFNGMTGRDWSVFFGSLLIANIYWTLACSMGISLFEWVWDAMTKSVS